MLETLQLAAIVRQGKAVRLLRIPLHRKLQRTLAQSWDEQLSTFMHEAHEIDFDAGYAPELHERFRILDFQLPDWLKDVDGRSAADLDEVARDDNLLDATTGIVGFACDQAGREMLLFQNFARSHVIEPGRFLLLKNNTYESTDRSGMTLEKKLSAVYLPADRKLLFKSFRTVNTFLPLADFYREASEQDIREILAHPLLAPEDVEAFAVGSNQWFGKRFAMLRDSEVLDKYSVREIQSRARGYDLDIHTTQGRIVFPAEKEPAKRLLQFLNEELFRGAITEKLYETNSKRPADG